MYCATPEDLAHQVNNQCTRLYLLRHDSKKENMGMLRIGEVTFKNQLGAHRMLEVNVW